MQRGPQSSKGQQLTLALLLEVFAANTLDMYNQEQLISELKASRITETKYGHYELQLPRTKDGHCDLLVAFSLAVRQAQVFTKPPAPVRLPIANSPIRAYNPDDLPRRYMGLGLYL